VPLIDGQGVSVPSGDSAKDYKLRQVNPHGIIGIILTTFLFLAILNTRS
jgi:hypothetical protein